MPFDVEVILPCFKRPEYTYTCIEALEQAQKYDNVFFHLWDDCSEDGTDEILNQANLEKRVVVNKKNAGLRNILISFLSLTSHNTKYIAKIDNDVLMPKNWLNDIISIMEKSDVDILSPNVSPSNAAESLGEPDVEGKGYMRANHVGGLWVMKRSLINGMDFEKYENVRGINGAFEILNQIILEKEPKVGWVHNVVAQDIGHWSGTHPLCIKSEDHRNYYAYVNRKVSW